MIRDMDFYDIAQEVISIRRQLHRFPELSLNEYKTSEFICNFLEKLGISCRRAANTGVIAVITKGEKLPTIAIRAEIDALPIQEENTFEYSSKNNGVMHACGHDGIIAVALGLAKYFCINKNKLKSNLKFIFEPGEEVGKGAKALISDGALESPKVDKIFIFHFTNSAPSGMEIQESVSTAEICSLKINIKGKSSHWGEQHKGIDAIYAGSEVICAIHKINETYKSLMPKVLGIGMAHGGVKNNIIAESFELGGTLRTFCEEDRNGIIELTREKLKDIEKQTGALIGFNIVPRIPPIVNDSELVKIGTKVGREVFGKNMVVSSNPFLAGDNAAFYFKEAKGLRVVFFAEKEGEVNYPLHNARFDFNEDILPMALKTLIKLVIETQN